MKCNICHGIYGFDLWKEIHTNRLVFAAKHVISQNMLTEKLRMMRNLLLCQQIMI